MTFLAEDPSPAPVFRAAVQFCRKCGDPLAPIGGACESCDRLIAASKATKVTIAGSTTPIWSVMGLFFVLLTICLGQYLVTPASGVPPVNYMFAAELILAAVVVGWALVQWEIALPALKAQPSLNWYAMALCLSLITFGIAEVTTTWLELRLHLPGRAMMRVFETSGYGAGAAILCVAVQPAIIEELAFRGLVLPQLCSFLRAHQAVFVSALMFMILHLSPMRFPHTFALGVGSGLLRLKTKSIYPCMLMHFSHNLMCVVIDAHGIHS